MNYQYMRKWSSLIRPIFYNLRFSHGNNGISLKDGILSRHITEAGVAKRNNLTIDQFKSQSGMMMFQTTKTVTRRKNWNTRQIKSFHTSSRQLVNPIFWVFLKPLAKFSAAMTGRSVRKWFKGLDPAERQKVWAAIKRHWYIPVGVCAALAGSGGVYYVTHIEETPVTGRKRFIALTHQQIVKIAEIEAAELIEKFQDKQFMASDPQSKRVLQVAQRLIASNAEMQKMQFKEWQIYVIRDPLVNACVLPSGHMFVFDGILQLANTQDQLAIILGHEMAHAVLEHGVEELSLGNFVDVFVVFCLAAIWCIIPFDGIALITHWFYDKIIKMLTHMPHSRLLEKEADKVGLMFAAKACYDIRQGSILWKKMSYNEKLSEDSSKMLPEWMTTHPDSLKRADHLDFLQTEAEKWREEKRCPKLPTEDPREAIKVLSQQVDNMIIASKTGQDLRRVQQRPGLVTIKTS